MECKQMELLLVLGIIHMLLEYVLGKRATVKGGPGSVMAVIGLLLAIVYSLIKARFRGVKK